jgi:hypothetical protein
MMLSLVGRRTTKPTTKFLPFCLSYLPTLHTDSLRPQPAYHRRFQITVEVFTRVELRQSNVLVFST